MYPYQYMYPYMGMRMMPKAGLLSGLRTGGLIRGANKLNFGTLLNNASKTLGVVNQALPLVKEAGPMISNMKSMLKIASVFKDETDSPVNINSNSVNTSNTNYKDTSNNTNYSNNNYNSPNFFI